MRVSGRWPAGFADDNFLARIKRLKRLIYLIDIADRIGNRREVDVEVGVYICIYDVDIGVLPHIRGGIRLGVAWNIVRIPLQVYVLPCIGFSGRELQLRYDGLREHLM